MKTKNHYQILVAEYKKRKRTPKNARKLKVWQQAIRRIKKQEGKIKVLDNDIKEFFGISVRGSSKSRKREYNLARAIFYRYGMENGIHSSRMAAYTGHKHYDHLFRSRLNFIRSFITNAENKDIWNRFIQSLNDKQ